MRERRCWASPSSSSWSHSCHTAAAAYDPVARLQGSKRDAAPLPPSRFHAVREGLSASAPRAWGHPLWGLLWGI